MVVLCEVQYIIRTKYLKRKQEPKGDEDDEG